MIEQASKTGAQLNATFVPKDLIRKGETKNINTLTSKKQFEKTIGNMYIEFEPAEIKFAGYELNKVSTATIKIVNKAPIPQRVHILPPQEACFTIKVNKKGPIASGMSEIIQVFFKSSEHKYQHDVIKIHTETENFVIPLYAYPTVPNLRSIFPKLIDFGSVELKEPSSNYYPIMNPVPVNFEYQFVYQKECQEIMIHPIAGILPASETLNIEITFIPNIKRTYIAEVFLRIKQFDFEPIFIKIMGSGKYTQKRNNTTGKKVKSSKLAPLAKESSKVFQAEDEKRKNITFASKQCPFNSSQLSQTGGAMKKTNNIRTGFLKLLNTKKSALFEEDQSKTMNPAKIAEREYINKFQKMQEMDKEKEVKFSTFLGDRAMTEEEIQLQRQVSQQLQNAIMRGFERSCIERYNLEINSNVHVEYKILEQKQISWDDKKNDEHHQRRTALQRFMNAGSKVILKYRMLKRLEKMKAFIGDSKSKQEIKKKVQESHVKALDQQQGGNNYGSDLFLDFSMNSLRPSFYQLQFDQSSDSMKEAYFKPEGRTVFDDLKEVKQLQPNKQEILKFAETAYPSDFVNLSKNIAPPRFSGQQQYAYKSSAIPHYEPFAATSIYALPIKVQAHHFIYDDQNIRRYKNYNEKDEKDLEYLFEEEGPIQDQFEGWTTGDHQILKAKFSRNTGCEYTTFNSFNESTSRKGLGPFATFGQHLPHNINSPQLQDTIHEGDSDQEDLAVSGVDLALKLLQKIEASSNDLKDRREKKVIRNPQRDVKKTIQKALLDQKQKVVSDHIGRIRDINKFAQKTQNRMFF